MEKYYILYNNYKYNGFTKIIMKQVIKIIKKNQQK